MPDLYAQISEVSLEVQKRLADVLEARANDPRQREMLKSYLSEIAFPDNARVLEIGCGTGPVTRALAGWPRVSQAIGVDPSTVFVAKATELAKEVPNVSFRQGDGRSLPFPPASFDIVVAHTTMCHIPEPHRVLAEAHKVLRGGGWLAIFDGDYATATVATGDFDPLEACIDAFRSNFVHDQWLVRRLPRLIRSAGFEVLTMRSHGYVEAQEGGYMLTWVERGADVLLQAGRISEEAAASLKAEAHRRSASKEWFGHIAFASVLARTAA